MRDSRARACGPSGNQLDMQNSTPLSAITPSPRRRSLWAPIVAVVALVALGLPSMLSAAAPFSVAPELYDHPLGAHIDILEDPGASLAIEEVCRAQPPAGTAWRPVHSATHNFGFTRSAFWVRLAVANEYPRAMDWYMEIGYPMLDHIELYQSGPAGWEVRRTGDQYPFAQRDIEYRNFMFALTEAPSSSRVLYLRFQSSSAMNIALAAWRPHDFVRQLNIEHPALWMYYGLFLSLILYNLFMYYSVREHLYLYYILFLVSFFFCQLTLNGLAFQYLWPARIWWANACLPLFMCSSYLWGALFSRRYLNLSYNWPFFDTFLLVTAFAAAVGMAISLLVPYRYSIVFGTLVCTLAIIPLPPSVWLSLKGSRPAHFFNLSWAAFIIGIFLYTFKTFGILPHTFITNWSIQIGSAFQAFLLALGLTDRLTTMQGELRALNVQLEDKVRERTAELVRARDALWGEMELAKKIQTTLLPQRPAIGGYEITAYMAPASEVGGDYYDIINMEGKDWIVIGDVSGHGVPAGLIMMMAQTAIRTALHQHAEMGPAQLLSIINRTITENIRLLREAKYMTITVLACIDNGVFHFAGLHQDILVHRRARGAVEVIETRGFWIGMQDDPDIVHLEQSLTLEPGDTMLLYTDGITEAWRRGTVRDLRDPRTDMFGQERLIGILSHTAPESPDAVKREILAALRDYDCHDDVTMVILRRTGE
ncbi:MAG TPA: 7TM diverse intracellular signaling domain-containing protein [Spirochaetota bacterium]|nr:7TM diverse intracellular signaling domain-containing protein [Spirochaetota bacterium]